MCAFNRTVSKVHDFLQNEAKGSKVIGAESLEDMVSKLKKPRRVILLVKAGKAVDDFIDKLVGNFGARPTCRDDLSKPDWILTGGALPPQQVPLLEAGDIIIDGGNSEYNDTTVAHGEAPHAAAGLSVATEEISHGGACLCVSPFGSAGVRV